MVGHRPSDWHVLDLDKDPTPGDPQRVRTLAKTLHDFADDVSDALRLVKGMAGEGALAEWAGKSATVFKEEFSGVPKNLTKLEKSYGMCGDALADFWPKLERAQALADKALIKAREARDDLSSAQSKLSSADSWVTRASKEADKYKDDPTGSKSDADKPDEGKVRAATRDFQHAKTAQTNAQSAVDSAQSALDAAKKMAADARKMRDDAARDAKNKIDEASDAGIQNRSWWEDIGDWFTDNWDNIVAVCKVVVAVVGIVAMIIGGPILGAIVLVAGLVVLADSLYKYSKGQASLWDVGLAALDCIPGMKGLTTLGGLAKGLKGGMAAMAGIKGGLKGMGLALRGLGKNARGMVADGAKGAYNRVKSVVRSKGSDPIDMATGVMYLPQEDVQLPGLLPLVFTRRTASNYRCGWWFGPTWASTIDQRIEVDEKGIVLVTEDGLLLEYPHPVAGEVTAMPLTGPRQPLTRLDDGGYQVEDPLTGQFRHFSPPGADRVALLARITDRNQNTITFDHDAYGNPHAIRHSAGYHIKVTTSSGRITELSLAGADADGSDLVIKRYGYTDGNLTETINSSGRPFRFSCDERLRITSWTDTNGHRYAYAYDDRDRCITASGEAGHFSLTLDYEGADPEWPECRVTTLTTAEGTAHRFVVNDNCQVVAEVDALGHIQRTGYDENHHVVSRMDALNHVTRLENNAIGQPVRVVRPDGHVIRAEYNELALMERLVGADSLVQQHVYDERGNRTAEVDRAGNVTGFTYDEAGRLTSVTDALGHETTVRCDRAGLPLEVTDPLGGVTRYERDALGRPTGVTEPTGARTCFEWTVEGRLLRRAAPDGTAESWTYDGEGNCTSHTDALGGVTHYEYTHFDLLAARTTPDGARYEFAHDAGLRVTNVTEPSGLTWRYEYDAAGRLVTETDFDNRTLDYAYDAASRLVSRHTQGQTVRFERDAMGQLVRKDTDGLVTTYVYDPAGRLLQAVGPGATLERRYDRQGRLLQESVNGRALTYDYDAVGRRTGRKTPGGVRSTWRYDALGNRSTMVFAGREINFTFDEVGRELTRHISGTDLAYAHGYDASGRLVSQSVTGPGAAVLHREFTYRADGCISAVDDRHSGSRRFELDQVGRVTAVHAHQWTERYAYDGAGNQTSASWPERHAGDEALGDRVYTGSRLLRAGRVRYEHDARGRIVIRQKSRLSGRRDTWRYAWDAEDRLTSVTTPDGTLWRYAYDPLGRRIAKSRMDADGETVVERVAFTWDAAKLCEQTTEASATSRQVTLTWDHQGQRVVAQAERLGAAHMPQEEIDSRFFAIVTDGIGTPTDLVDESGAVAWRARTTLWGITAWPRDCSAYTPLRWPGQYYDPETGLHYNYFRHYDPETGRYVTSDPLGLSPAPNPFTYVRNPLRFTDVLGLAPDYPLGERGNPFGTRAEAERAAFDVAGVPHGSSPDAEWIVMGDKAYKNMPGYVYSKDPTHWGNFRQFETDSGSRVIVEHTHDPAGPHFHAGAPKGMTPEERSRNLVNFGWDNTQEGYGTMERYRALDKPGGDHHFFYQD
ncbi:RHS domain-containing protein [Streptomyces sp. b94]|uniref:RHS repeat-associated core domain-containing protein n=1 Tax=Streptomyces sp. b94 TaxID=1827634 RepID=UPI001B391941|nr:RHS repeat-associated core domain-containing protein [Streptomyces sp. b94]MBQ1094843.1 RHS domain-containing protein [Streptomyces sp. b94]